MKIPVIAKIKYTSCFLMLAVIGVIIFSVSEPLYFLDIPINAPGSNNNDSIKVYTTNPVSSERITFTRMIRAFTPYCEDNIVVYYIESSLQAAVSNYVPSIKDTILLKLLI